MKVLQEFVEIIQQEKTSLIPFKNDPQWKESQLAVFYEGILKKAFSSDKEAMAFLFQGRSTSKYKYLKAKLKKFLINTILYKDPTPYISSDQQRAYSECWRDLAAVKILFNIGSTQASIAVSRQLLLKAKRFEFTVLITEVLRLLCTHYSTIEGDAKKFELYKKQLQHFENIRQAENHTEELYCLLILDTINSKSAKGNKHTIASNYYQKILPYLGKYQSYRLHLYGNLIRIMIFMSQNNYLKTIQICEEAIQFFRQKRYVPKFALQILLHQQLVCCIQLKAFEKGKKIAEESLSLIPKGSFNWFKQQELFFLLAFHTQRYQEAPLIYHKTISHRRFHFLPENLREIWRIKEAYLQYLLQLAVIEDPTRKTMRRFKLSKFLNEVPIFSKDKRGMNIPILIIQILFLILQRKYDATILRMEAIEKYNSRYLRKKDTFRSHCFIKMLLLIPTYDFNKIIIEKKAEKYIKLLHSTPLEIAHQPFEIEIIPYETLWTFTLDSIQFKASNH